MIAQVSEFPIQDYIEMKLNENDTLLEENEMDELTKLTESKQIIVMKQLILGKDYKKSKLYFINNYQNFITYNNDKKKITKISLNVISKIYQYLDFFLINDLEDLVYILGKRNKHNMESSMQIYSYIENLFNDSLYLLLIEKVVKIRYNTLINSKAYINNKNNEIFDEYNHKNALIYVGIVRTEIFKILMF